MSAHLGSVPCFQFHPHEQVLTLSQLTQSPVLPDYRSTLLHTWLSLYLGARPDCTGTGSLPPALQPGAPRQPGHGLEGGLSAVSSRGRGEVRAGWGQGCELGPYGDQAAIKNRVLAS